MSITRFAIQRQHLIKDHLLQGIHNYVTQGDRETNRETDTERHRHRETQRQTEDTEADRGRQKQAARQRDSETEVGGSLCWRTKFKEAKR